ncbi:hypothetical protein KSP40_PGU012560 [Platanthera guangdongensis]|uniref:Uncharacterized protein n=1 Tax=Platanthera guangdongensis TaxID=2320717 RepID=A0ABR2LT14_9ASPA
MLNGAGRRLAGGFALRKKIRSLADTGRRREEARQRRFRVSRESLVEKYISFLNVSNKSRNMKILEAGLLLHPLLPLEKSNVASQSLKKIIRGISDSPIDTGRNSESMQVLRSTVMSLACRITPGLSFDICHWADDSPFNLNFYQMLSDVLFDNERSVVEEIDYILELIKNIWVVFGLNQIIHNLLFLWFLFRCFLTVGQTNYDFPFAADNQLMEVANDTKTTK